MLYVYIIYRVYNIYIIRNVYIHNIMHYNVIQCNVVYGII